ncbi:MAG TPA: acetamidase/formamidase family protein [Steroidobacteraceae bacterium]|nr:acetamidase/formamidase family protein [Steroidobacteraceae bacterium]
MQHTHSCQSNTRSVAAAKHAAVVSAAYLLMALAMPPLHAAPKTHELIATPATVHRGFFDGTLPAVMTIDSGDIVKLATATGNPKWFENLGVPKEKIPAELYAAFEGVEGAGRGDHTLNGPIAIRGAEPGDMLEIRIRKVDVRLPIAGQGFNLNRGALPEQFPYAKSRVLWIDMKRKVIEYAPGVEVPAKPFWGVMGTAPPVAMGRVPSGAPNIFGGNMDNRDLGAGATLYLPVYIAGGMFSVGDGHAAQGHGEVCVSAVEASLKGEVQIILHKGKTIKWPRAETPTHYMTMGLNTDLDEAAKLATSEMLDWIVAMKGLPRDDAYMLLSASMDLVVTQVVDVTKGVHAMMPKAVFRAKRGL